ncbi:hypothetical protein MBT84_03485 [Streptomyces sp. MBT84]|uniref:hypothetical protein n=1 Tax=unclassified Streptomyces TaxID=2593676 RepID=UPI001DB99D13|nr:hypothetical protein [Streptomyces sp. MBT84]MBW8698636.1 hypothetical protein [Streptomyces sp. MBT84]
MTRRLSINEAVGRLDVELRAAQQALSGLGTEDAWEAFLRSGRQLFDVSDAPDADGLLFQYGTYSFDGPPTFTVDLTRQFAVSDDDGAHGHYVQVHCEIRYGSEPALEALGSFDSWFFHGSGADLGEWARELTERSAWTTVGTFRPTEIRVFQERV